MMTFEQEVEIINNAVHVLNTGERIIYEGALQKGTKTINKAIKLHSIEVDMAILMLSKFFQTKNTLPDSGRVVQLLKNDDIGMHLVSLLDEYFWSYDGLIVINDTQFQSLVHGKMYIVGNRTLCTGFSKDNDINSFVLKEYR